MATIVDFPLWRAQRPPAEAGQTAQIVIFPGVRKEARSLPPERLLPVPHGAPGPLREDREG